MALVQVSHAAMPQRSEMVQRKSDTSGVVDGDRPESTARQATCTLHARGALIPQPVVALTEALDEVTAQGHGTA